MSTTDCKGWEFIKRLMDNYNVEFHRGSSNSPYITYQGVWLGLCPDCRLSDSQVENMMR